MNEIVCPKWVVILYSGRKSCRLHGEIVWPKMGDHFISRREIRNKWAEWRYLYLVNYVTILVFGHTNSPLVRLWRRRRDRPTAGEYTLSPAWHLIPPGTYWYLAPYKMLSDESNNWILRDLLSYKYWVFLRSFFNNLLISILYIIHWVNFHMSNNLIDKKFAVLLLFQLL